jgi:hypothetical protein
MGNIMNDALTEAQGDPGGDAWLTGGIFIDVDL